MIFHIIAFIVSAIAMFNVYAGKLPLSNLPEADVFVDAGKGFVLQYVGRYSDQLETSILHTFIPLLDLCKRSPTIDVCVHILKSDNPNIMQLATTMSANDLPSTIYIYDKQEISNLISRNVRSTISVKQPGQFIKYIPSNFHILDNSFYIPKSVDENFASILNNTLPIDQQVTPYRPHNSPVRALDQLMHNQIGFNFLTNEEIDTFIIPLMSTLDNSYRYSNQDTMMADFSRLIVAQSIHLLRSCSIEQNHIEPYPSCIVMSTLFQRLPPLGPLSFAVYHLTPIPISIHGQMYIYENVPKTFGINILQQTMLLWNNGDERSECVFGKIVQCRQRPITVPFSKSICLNELLSADEYSQSICSLKKTANSVPGVINIAEDIWAFNNINETWHCKPYSTSDLSGEPLTITEPTLLRVPCQQSIQCVDVALPSLGCTKKKVMVKSTVDGVYENLSTFQLPLTQMKRRLEVAYNSMARNVLNQLENSIQPNKTLSTQIFQKSGNLITDIVLFTLITIFLLIIRILKMKFQQQIDKIEKHINKLDDIFSLNNQSV